MNNNKRVYLIIGVITITMLVMGVTTAWFTWNSTDNTDVTFNVNGLDIINTNVDIIGKKLYPTNNKENGVVEEFTVKQNSDISTPVCSDFTLTLTTLPTELQHKSFKYKMYRDDYVSHAVVKIVANGDVSSCITTLVGDNTDLTDYATKVCNGVNSNDEVLNNFDVNNLLLDQTLTVEGAKINDVNQCVSYLNNSLDVDVEIARSICNNPGYLVFPLTYNPDLLNPLIDSKAVEVPMTKITEKEGTSLVGSGNFEGKTQGQVITIATNQYIDDLYNIYTSKYKLYIWIDGSMDNPLSMGGKSFLFKLGIKVNQQENTCTPSVATEEPNEPVLAEGMIPIKWDGSKWVKASTDNWYNYSNKEWANAVMVRTDKDSNVNGSRSREQYMSADEGTKILESDILAYYVWIPRYKYQLFNVNSESMSPIEIQVMFEGKGTTKSTGSTNGSWLTHPAFTFGTDELSGIWVGKFETSGTASAPTIKPNLNSLVNQNVSTQFATSQKFGTSTYLSETAEVDAHMMKNTEWGAVAYLKQSKYGLGTTDIANNAYYASSSPYYMAGCGPKSETDLTSTATTCTSYTSTIGVKSSTTGNVYGVYDMAGGAWEYVMGMLKTEDGTGLTYSSSGFTASTLPFGSKYVDACTYGTLNTDYTRRILGDATGETRGWYSDYADFPSSPSSFFFRGGNSLNGSNAGVFYFNISSGRANSFIAFRSTLATQ